MTDHFLHMSFVLAEENGQTLTIYFRLIDPVKRYASTFFTILHAVLHTIYDIT